ncbi:MAG: histidine phosphatase family protein [Thermodesulfobacteriota bacterium]
MRTTLFLVRHGVTAANQEDRFAGRSGEPLHPDGIRQMRSLGDRLQGLGLAAIHSGPLPRTRESATILGQALGLPVHTEAGFNEMAIPHWDSLAKDEIRRRFGDQYPVWKATPHRFQAPGCETLAAVQARAVQAAEALADRYPGQAALVVSHLIVLRCLILHYQGLPLDDFRAIRCDNSAVWVVQGLGTREPTCFPLAGPKSAAPAVADLAGPASAAGMPPP